MSDEALASLDVVLHQPSRIRIMSRLVVLRRARFAQLRKLTDLSAGNLASHLEALAAVGYLELRHALLEKSFGKYAFITEAGDGAYRGYIERLERVLAELKRDLPRDRSPHQAGGGG